MTTGVFIMLLLSANLSIKRCRPANTDILPLQRLQVPDTSRYAADKNSGKADNPSSPERTSCGNTRIIKLRPADEPAAQGTTVISFVPQDTGIEVRLFAIVAKPKTICLSCICSDRSSIVLSSVFSSILMLHGI